ncbi:hypothetical protein R6Q57_008262 [Mikania cordata]
MDDLHSLKLKLHGHLRGKHMHQYIPAISSSSTSSSESTDKYLYTCNNVPSFAAAASHSSSGVFGCPLLFGQGTQKGDAFASNSFGSETVFGSATGMTNYGPLSTRLAFDIEKSHLDGQGSGRRISVYKKTAEAAYSAEKLVSISAMPAFKDKSHEELRWEDCNLTREGWFGLTSSAVQSRSPATKFSTTSWGTPSISRVPLKQPPPLPSNPFEKGFCSVATETTTWKYPGPRSTSFTLQPSQFSSSANTCLTTITSAPSNSFNPFVLGTTPTPATSTTSSISLAPLNYNLFINPSSSLAMQTSSSSPTFAAFTSDIDCRPSSSNAFWSTPIAGPFISTSNAIGNSILVSPVSSGSSSTFNQPTILSTPSVPSAQNCNGTTGIIGQTSFSQLPSSQITSTAASPFGLLPPNSCMCFDGSQSKQSIQYGISSIPIKDKRAMVKCSLLTTRHLSGRIKLPVRKYDPKLIDPKKPFFCDTKEIPVAAYVPRENPRALVCHEKWPLRAMMENIYEEKLSGSTYEDTRDDQPTKDQQFITKILDVPSKLQQPDYYTQPQISELEAKERAERGYCTRVKDFVVGRHGYGSIKFLGETDVRNIDIETHVQFNNREVIVYMVDSKKPRVGEGLNKAAEITLLNIKCINKKTGMQYTHGSKINKYTEMLKKKAEAQGIEFMSYDPVKGEWKFRVQHF